MSYLAKFLAVLLAALLLTPIGCRNSDATQLLGGTTGQIQLRGITPAELQVNVFADVPGAHRLAYGVSDSQGHFSLITDDGQEPCILPPGQYRVTIESVAADPIPVPRGYGDVRTTPLKTTWPTDNGQLQFIVH